MNSIQDPGMPGFFYWMIFSQTFDLQNSILTWAFLVYFICPGRQADLI
jgi:hypothetical protein